MQDWMERLVASHRIGGGESQRAHGRRTDSGFYIRYAKSDYGRTGLDVGCGGDCLYLRHIPDAVVYGFDAGDGDAHHLSMIPDRSLDFVYTSHLLEHLEEPEVGLSSFVRVVKPTGHLIMVIPHRDYYEKRLELPSQYNGDHKRFYLPFANEAPDTTGAFDFFNTKMPMHGREWRWMEFLTELDGNTNWRNPHMHANGLFNIVIVIQVGA